MGDFLRPAASMRTRVTASAAALATASAPPQSAFAPASLRILHILRAPLGGLFRHVLDVARGQSERGHRVGLIVDSTTGGGRADAVLADLAPDLALGLQRIAIRRELSLSDVRVLRSISHRIKLLAPDVLHGHGAKGAALARLALGAPHTIRVYTPHGGSLLYRPGTFIGGFYRTLEWLLKWHTDLFLFESSYVADLFRSEIGAPQAMVRVVRNGVGEAEFAPVAIRPDATDLVCVGELRPVKAVDLLIEALAMLKRAGRRVSATIAGEGPQDAELMAQAERRDVADQIRFVGYRPAREAFAMGRIFVIPSRAESLPYVVLEGAAAGVPIIATSVGGIPEIFGPQAAHLVSPGDAAALAGAIRMALDDPAQLRRVTAAVQARVRSNFSLAAMVEEGLAAYRAAIAMRRLAQRT